MRWEELPMASRARLMAAAVRNGYTDIRSIKEAYANYQDLKLTTGNRYDEGGEFEVVNLLDNVPVEYDTEDTGYTPWFIQNTEHAPDNPMTNQQYYSLMEKVATENNPILNAYRKEEGLPELTVDEEYTRILNDSSYDYRGYYNDPAVRNSNDNANTHWPDEYKTAYHPTFSTYSLYSGMVDPNYNPTGKNGGLWFGDNYVNYNKNVYGGNLFNNGGAKNLNVGGVKGLLNLFDKYHIPYKQTSGLRKGAKTASGHASYHSMTDVWGNPRAVDITGDFNKIKEMAYSNPEIVAYMRKEGLGILEETTSDVKKKTHATGDHFHIGPDKWAIQMRDNNINKYNVTYHPMQDVTWSDVQERKQLFELTPEEETLLGTSALGTYNPEYVDRNDPNYRSLADAVALDESLDTPANNWAKWNAFLSMQSGQSDPISSYSAIQQKEEPSLYQLFAPQGDDYMYHGLNFAAYGGKVNKFDVGGKYNDTFMKLMGLRWVPADQVQGDYREKVLQHDPNGTYAVDANSNYVPASRMETLWTDYLAKQDQPDIAIDREIELAKQHRANERFNNSIDTGAIGLISAPLIAPVFTNPLSTIFGVTGAYVGKNLEDAVIQKLSNSRYNNFHELIDNWDGTTNNMNSAENIYSTMIDPGMIIGGLVGTPFTSYERPIPEMYNATKSFMNGFNSSLVGRNFWKNMITDIANPNSSVIDALNEGRYAINKSVMNTGRAKLENSARNAFREAMDIMAQKLMSSPDRNLTTDLKPIVRQLKTETPIYISANHYKHHPGSYAKTLGWFNPNRKIALEYPLFENNSTNIMIDPADQLWNLAIYHEPVHVAQSELYPNVFVNAKPTRYDWQKNIGVMNEQTPFYDVQKKLASYPNANKNYSGDVTIPEYDNTKNSLYKYRPWDRKWIEFDAEQQAFMMNNGMPSTINELSLELRNLLNKYLYTRFGSERDGLTLDKINELVDMQANHGFEYGGLLTN